MTDSDKRIMTACERAAQEINAAAKLLEAGGIMLISLQKRPLWTPTTPSVRVVVEIRNGIVHQTRIAGLPADVDIDVEVHDYDIDGIPDDDLHTDADNQRYHIHEPHVMREVGL